jgi:hypothetical protein
MALPHIRIVSVNPGLCTTGLSRHFPKTLNWQGIKVGLWFGLNSRTAEVGSRNLSVTALADLQYWSSCHAVGSPSKFLSSKTGLNAIELYWKQLVEEMEETHQGCTSVLQKV